MKLRTLIAILPLFAAPLFATAGPDHPGGFDDLIRQGRNAFLASDLDRAESSYNQACPANLVNTYPVAEAVTCENVLASVDEARGNLVRAEQRFLHAVTGAEQAGPAYQPLYCARLIDLGEHYHRQGRLDEAEASLLKAVELARTLTASQPRLLPQALMRLGGFYSDSAKPERGRAPLIEALAIISASQNDAPATPPVLEIAYGHNFLGMIDLAAGRRREAESNLRESVALATSTLGEDHAVTAAYETNLAATLLVDRQFDSAALLLRRAQFVVESRRNAPGSELAVICAEMSAVELGEGKLAQAEQYALRSISILNQQPRLDARNLAIAQVTLGGIYVRSHDTAAAEKILPQAVRVQREMAVNPVTLASGIQLLGELRAQQRQWQAADELFREALAIYEKDAAGSVNPALAPLLLALADVLKHEGASKSEVQALESRARDILRSAPRSTPRA